MTRTCGGSTSRLRSRFSHGRALWLVLCCVTLLTGCSTPFSTRDATTVVQASPAAPIAPNTASPPAIATPIPTRALPPAGTPAVISAATPSIAPQPKGTQSLTLVGGIEDPLTLDPALVRDADAAFIDQQLFRGLVHLESNTSVAPDLARTIEISPDHLVYTFHLYSGLTFQSGRPLQAADVKYSFDRATDPALAVGSAQPLPAAAFLSDIKGAPERLSGSADSISGVQVLDALTMRITLAQPNADFLQKLTGLPAVVVDRANVEQGGDWWREPDGSGPFKLTSWKSNAQITLSGFPGYLPQPPTLKTVNILLGASAEQPETLYERGQIDVAPVGDDVLARVLAPGTPLHDELHSEPLLGGEYILINPNIPPFDDPRLRQALIQAFDRSKIASVTFDGHVNALNGIAPVVDQTNTWAAPVAPYDPEAAKALLQQVSSDVRSQSLTMYTAGSWTPAAMSEVYQQELGLTVEVVDLDWSAYVGQMQAQKLGMFALNWIADYPNPGSVIWNLFGSNSPNNVIGYHNAEVDRLLARAEAEADPQRQLELYRQAQNLIVKDNVVIPIYGDVDYELVKPKVHGLRLSPLGMLGLESVWIAQ